MQAQDLLVLDLVYRKHSPSFNSNNNNNKLLILYPKHYTMLYLIVNCIMMNVTILLQDGILYKLCGALEKLTIT